MLISHGHDKYKILHEYSKEEVALFYEKCVKYDMRHEADFIEAVMAGIGGAFSDKKNSKNIEKLLKELRA